ncbi:hypothetical protein Tco_0680781 [Tanacetum coccineum]|uniref:Uncharacterized protein n=1 Tax=Tanacetum coccineum TaxID=301880 RepID=A0ABQ4XMC7_9ASTR
MRLSIRSWVTEWKGLPLLLLSLKQSRTVVVVQVPSYHIGDVDVQTRFEAASKSPMIYLSQEVTHLEVGRTRVTRGYSGEDIPLFPSMITAPETSPSRITSSPSLSPHHTPVSAPSTSPPPIIETTPTIEEPAPMPHELPLQSVQSLGRDEDSGRSLIEELDMDADISLVPPHDAEIQEKISDDTEVTTADTALNTASVPISTASETPEVITAAESLVYIRRSAKKKKDKARKEYDKAGKKEAVTEIDTAYVIDWNDPSVIRYHALQNRPDCSEVWDQIHSFMPMESKKEVQRLKRAGQDVEAEPAKRQRTKEVSESVQE